MESRDYSRTDYNITVKVNVGNTTVDMYLQQITEKTIVAIASPTRLEYFDRKTGKSRDADVKMSITEKSLLSIGELMSLLGKQKWHSGFKPSVGTAEIKNEQEFIRSGKVHKLILG